MIFVFLLAINIKVKNNLSCMRFLIMLFIAASLLVMSVKADSSRKIELNVALAQQQGGNESYITIDSLQEYSIDRNISIPLVVYRGTTLKRTVYVWLQDDDGKRISSKSKHSLTTRFQHYNLSASFNLSCRPSADYTIVAEGLGINSTKKVHLEFLNCTTQHSTSQGDVSFVILDYPEAIASGSVIRTRILVSNPTGDNLEFDAWSYVYRSSKCYSGGREQNKKTINLPEFSNVTFDLENVVNATAGEYNMKVKLLRSDRKTSEEMTVPITVLGGSIAEAREVGEKLSLGNIKGDDTKSANTTPQKRQLLNLSSQDDSKPVYESSSAKARNLTVYFLIAALAILLVMLILKKL
jgi:hypothetical protein